MGVSVKETDKTHTVCGNCGRVSGILYYNGKGWVCINCKELRDVDKERE